MRIACCWSSATTTVPTRTSNPHQVPSARQPRVLHARRIRIKLTSGIIMPMDFSASLVHKVQSESIVNHIVDNPSTASAEATAANCTGESPVGRTIGKLALESRKVDIIQPVRIAPDLNAIKCIAIVTPGPLRLLVNKRLQHSSYGIVEPNKVGILTLTSRILLGQPSCLAPLRPASQNSTPRRAAVESPP